MTWPLPMAMTAPMTWLMAKQHKLANKYTNDYKTLIINCLIGDLTIWRICCKQNSILIRNL